MRQYFVFALMLSLLGCAELPPQNSSTVDLQGQWVTEEDGNVMLDPQTSALKLWRGKLLSVSDGSADISQRLQLHIIDPETAQVESRSLAIGIAQPILDGCFGPYLSAAPDLEALAIDPNDDSTMILVTEDATRSEPLTKSCAKQYAQTGSTDYPTLLLKVTLQQDDTLLLDGVRPVQFAQSFDVGNSPNDGIEGLAFGADRTLYLGLEKDAVSQARIFSVKIDDDFWLQQDFVKVEDPQLRLPSFNFGNHPINGMDYYPTKTGKGVLIAAARNDNQLWIIDLDKRVETKVVSLRFFAPTTQECGDWELMDNSSLEGVATVGERVFVINDPWKAHYEENIICPSNRNKYESMAPLLFSMPIDPQWLPN